MARVTIFMRYILFLLLFAFTIYASSSEAAPSKTVAETYRQIESALNNKEDPLQKVRVLHDLINESAQFIINVDNPVLNEAQNSAQKRLDKIDYINSFFIGTRYIDNYSATIKTVSVEHNQDDNTAISQITLKETGNVLDPYDLEKSGKPFVSVSQCQTWHDEANKIIASQCKTNVSYDQAI